MEQRTILFVDQVGSTRQLAEIGDVAMVEVRQRLWSIINAAAASHEGRVFSDEGDGGAIAFVSASTATDAVLQIIAAARESEIALRAGLHTGPVVPNGDGFVGLTVHTAARLCEGAPSGHVLTTEADAAENVGDRARFTAFGQRTLKGFAEPTVVMLLTDPELGAPPLDDLLRSTQPDPIPSSPLLHADDDTFVGRTATVERLARFPTEHAIGADGVSTLLIDGPPGAGKSMLAHRRCRELVDSGVLCLVGRADDGLDDPLHEIIAPLEHLIRHAPIELLADHVLRHGDLLTRWIPGLGDRVPAAARGVADGAPAPDRRAIFDAVIDLLDATSRLQPIVLLIEDIHWATGPTLDLLRQLINGRPLPGASVVMTYRPTDVVDDGPTARFLAKVGTAANVMVEHVEPLDRADIRALVLLQLPKLVSDRHDLIEPITEHVERTTGGNALFCAEVLRHIDAAAITAASAAALEAVLTVPNTVQDLAHSRVDQLGESVAEVLADAAILGETFGTLDLMRMVGDRHDVLEVLDRAERAALVRADDLGGRRFRFGHALVQQALTTRLTTAARLGRHRRAADAIAEGDPASSRSAERLRHLIGAGVLAVADEVVSAAGDAAADATERRALPEAVAFRRVAVDALLGELSSPPGQLAVAWLALGLAQTAVSSATGGTSMVAAATCARDADDWDLFAETAVSYGGALKENQAADDVTEPVGLIREALEHHGEATSIRARLLISLALWLRQTTPYVDRRRWVDEAMTIAEALDDDRTTAAVLADWHRALHGANVAAEAAVITDRLEVLASSLDDATVGLQAVNQRLLLAVEMGDTATASRAAAQLEEVAARSRSFEARRLHLMWTVVQAYSRGEVEVATAASARLSVHLVDYPEGTLDRFSSALIFAHLWLSGHQDLIYVVTTERASLPASRAWFAAESGRIDEVAGHLDQVGGPAGIVERSDYMWWHDVVGCTRALRHVGDRAFAAELYDVVLPYRTHNAVLGLVSYLGCAEHHLGALAVVLGRLDDAIKHFDAALERYVELGARPFAALAEAELAQALELRNGAGDVERAALLRTSATATAGELALGTVIVELARNL